MDSTKTQNKFKIRTLSAERRHNLIKSIHNFLGTYVQTYIEERKNEENVVMNMKVEDLSHQIFTADIGQCATCSQLESSWACPKLLEEEPDGDKPVPGRSL